MYVTSGYRRLFYFSIGPRSAFIFTCQLANGNDIVQDGDNTNNLKWNHVGVITILNNTNEFSISKITTEILLVKIFYITRYSGERYVLFQGSF